MPESQASTSPSQGSLEHLVLEAAVWGPRGCRRLWSELDSACPSPPSADTCRPFRLCEGGVGAYLAGSKGRGQQA